MSVFKIVVMCAALLLIYGEYAFCGLFFTRFQLVALSAVCLSLAAVVLLVKGFLFSGAGGVGLRRIYYLFSLFVGVGVISVAQLLLRRDFTKDVKDEKDR